MRLTADELTEDGIADGVIREPEEGAAGGLKELCSDIKEILIKEVDALSELSTEELTEKRYNKYRSFDKKFF